MKEETSEPVRLAPHAEHLSDDSDIAAGIERLVQREARLMRRAERGGVLAALLIMAVVALAVTARLVAPDASLSTLDVPGSIASALSVPQSHSGRADSVIGGTNSEVALPRAALVPEGPGQSSTAVGKALWRAATSSGIEGIQEQLASAGMGNFPEGRYVLAQAAAIAPKDQATNTLLRSLAKSIGEDSLFAANPQVIYAVDVAAFGEPRSKIAIAYETGRRSTAASFSTAASLADGILLCILVYQFVLVSVYRSIRSRVRRIRDLFGGVGIDVV